MTTFKIHPAIGIARLGNAEHEFYLAPEQIGQLPIDANPDGTAMLNQDGTEKPIEKFKVTDNPGQVKRQGARFRIFAYPGENDDNGNEIKQGAVLTFEHHLNQVEGLVVDVEWTVHLANKKASWYEFKQNDGMHGYEPNHPLRNAHVTVDEERRQLIINPGPQTVSYIDEEKRHGHFKKGENPGFPQSFPPETIQPNPIDTLGEAMATFQDESFRLVVLGGHGNSGSTNISSHTGQPVITQYANNDGWFDDISDGPVTAQITYAYPKESTVNDLAQYKDQILGQIGKAKPHITVDGKKIDIVFAHQTVQTPAWVVVGYPGYVPEIPDMITMNELIYDVSVRYFAANPQMYGVEPYDAAHNSPKTLEELQIWRDQASWNPDYYTQFYHEIWPVLKRPDMFQWLYGFEPFTGADPHNKGTGGNLDQEAMSLPPQKGEDPNHAKRQLIYDVLRKPGQENLFQLHNPKNPATPADKRMLYGMPGLLGNNPLSNISPEKFLRLTNTQIFQMRQWADGKFVNECLEWGEGDKNCTDPFSEPPKSGFELDQGVLSNVLGGAFCPGGELTWIMLNPAIYGEPYRIKHRANYDPTNYDPTSLSLPSGSKLTDGLEPGDLTKYMALPWQADFAECTDQPIDITYENWANIYPDSTGDPVQQRSTYNVPWWPSHRPLVVKYPVDKRGDLGSYYWANIGPMQMVTAWSDVAFIHKTKDGYILTEYNEAGMGPLQPAGQTPPINNKRAA